VTWNLPSTLLAVVLIVPCRHPAGDPRARGAHTPVPPPACFNELVSGLLCACSAAASSTQFYGPTPRAINQSSTTRREGDITQMESERPHFPFWPMRRGPRLRGCASPGSCSGRPACRSATSHAAYYASGPAKGRCRTSPELSLPRSVMWCEITYLVTLFACGLSGQGACGAARWSWPCPGRDVVAAGPSTPSYLSVSSSGGHRSKPESRRRRWMGLQRLTYFTLFFTGLAWCATRRASRGACTSWYCG